MQGLFALIFCLSGPFAPLRADVREDGTLLVLLVKPSLCVARSYCGWFCFSIGFLTAVKSSQHARSAAAKSVGGRQTVP